MDKVREFTRNLDEALRWCHRRFSMENLRGSLRSPELKPSGDLFDPERATLVVNEVIARRRLLMNAAPHQYLNSGYLPSDFLGPHPRFAPKEWASWPPAQMVVRNVLAVFPGESLSDGTSPPPTGGFVDVDDLPPWDSWVLYDGGMLVSVVPPELVSAVEGAMAVNAYECIGWLGFRDHPLVDQLLRTQWRGE